MGARGLHQRLRHRQHGRGQARQGPGHADSRRRAQLDGGVAVLPRAGPQLRATSSTRRSSFFQGRGADGTFPSSFDPRGLGRRLHRDQRLELRLPRAARRPRPGQPLRRPGRARDRSSTRSSRRPENGDASPAATAASSTRCSRRATSAWASSARATRSVAPHRLHVRLRPASRAKTAEKVREIMRRLYVGGEIGQGYPGDEDNGEMSAWYILVLARHLPAAGRLGQLGHRLAEVRPGDASSARRATSSSTRRATPSATSTCRASRSTARSTRASRSARTSSRARPRSTSRWVPSRPTSGSRAQDAPPSLTQGHRGAEAAQGRDRPRPRHRDGDRPRVGRDAKALFDNTSRTAVAFTSGTPSVTFALSGVGQRATWYTVTSGPKAGDPSAWRLEGSKDDGETWQTLDTRTGQVFPWRVQTRPFEIAHTGHVHDLPPRRHGDRGWCGCEPVRARAAHRRLQGPEHRAQGLGGGAVRGRGGHRLVGHRRHLLGWRRPGHRPGRHGHGDHRVG